jgi:protein tyrosine phosphatase domain-containing protein 1
LQEPGEHPFCGDGINPKTGFSYTPELLMNEGISFFNFYWPDLTNPTFDMLLNTTQVMDFIIKQGGKVLVHCHAG